MHRYKRGDIVRLLSAVDHAEGPVNATQDIVGADYQFIWFVDELGEHWAAFSDEVELVQAAQPANA